VAGRIAIHVRRGESAVQAARGTAEEGDVGPRRSLRRVPNVILRSNLVALVLTLRIPKSL
jgi:hypothetical protein